MATGVGRLKLKIPQVRNLSFYPKSLERGCRSEKALKLAIAEMYVKGVSTRKVSVNGTVQDLAILKALGVDRWGKREVLGVSATLSEAEVHWRKFLQTLQRRGLQGVELVVSDDHVGLRAARRAVFPSVPWQRCQFHLTQNAQAHAHNRAQAREMGQAIRDIFNCPSLAYAEAMVTQVGEVAGGEHRGRLHGLSLCPVDPPEHPDHQWTGPGEQGDSEPNPGGRDLPQPRLGLEINFSCFG